MSWIEKIEKGFIIRMGNGKEFQPKWLRASKVIDYNVSEFNFPNLDGTLVYRGRPRGARYDLTLFFDGENNLDVAEAFKVSAEDPRAWTIEHPFYGNMIVHPTTLRFDNSAYNVTEITGTVIETITEDSPKTSVDPVDKINADGLLLQDIAAESFTTDVQPDVNDIIMMQSNNAKVYAEASKRIKLTADFEAYFNLYNEANTAIQNATAAPLDAITRLQSVLTYPFKFSDSVKNRIDILSSQFDSLRTTVGTLTRPSRKKIYENNAGMVVSSMATTSCNPQDGDYRNRNDVLLIIERIISAYDTYLADLDSLQTATGGDPESYIPDANSLSSLGDLVNFTISNLFAIALNSRQERSIFLEYDSNVILLAHRFYAGQDLDTAIDDIINNNDIGLNEMLGVKKGRKIIYYI